MSKAKKGKTNTFQDAVKNTPDIANCYQVGLRGLGTYSNKVQLSDTSKCSGSVDIDACTTEKYPQLNRWDYALGYKEKVYFVEVHTANTGQVSTVLRKLQWLKDWLNTEAPELNKLKAQEQTPFVWIQTNGFSILKNSKQYREVVQAGLKPIAKLVLG